MNARRRALAGVVALLASATSLGADSRHSTRRLGRHVELSPVLTRELFPQARGGAIAVDGSIEAALAPPLTVVREVPVAWELRVPAGTPIDELRVELELTGRDGRASALTRAGTRATMPASVTAGRPRIVRRESDSLVLAGSARVRLRVADVERAGRYEGTLTVRLAPR